MNDEIDNNRSLGSQYLCKALSGHWVSSDEAVAYLESCGLQWNGQRWSYRCDDATLGRMVRSLLTIAKAKRWGVEITVHHDRSEPGEEYWTIEFRDRGYHCVDNTPEGALYRFIRQFRLDRRAKRRTKVRGTIGRQR